ncbi:MAG: class I SAM-dependent methyltransferase [Verrucomicrobia bacterium]|nr:class I SAM-dependent methyltransferase [Verrucomicrobiota bacterium]
MKAKTRDSYDSSASEYAANVAHLHPEKEGAAFIQALPNGGVILDLGCGSGRDAKIFSEMGLQVIGIDNAEQMIHIARQTAPKATFYTMDLEELDFLKASFDGIWANCSLVHVQKKKIPPLLSHLHQLLKPNGILFIAVKKGTGEVVEKDRRYGGLEKFWSYFEQDELENLLKTADFRVANIVQAEPKHEHETHTMLKTFAKKF